MNEWIQIRFIIFISNNKCNNNNLLLQIIIIIITSIGCICEWAIHYQYVWSPCMSCSKKNTKCICGKYVSNMKHRWI